MKFGVREICEVVLKAKDDIKIGNKMFVRDEPVIYFDTLKTSTVEGAATTVYATGGRGNSRLLAWEGERTVTFTMEDALISPMGFAILSGAGLIEASKENVIHVHGTSIVATTNVAGQITVDLKGAMDEMKATAIVDKSKAPIFAYVMRGGVMGEKLTAPSIEGTKISFTAPETVEEDEVVQVLVDFYVEKSSGVQQLEITPDQFAGYYSLEAMTLFRRQDTGADMPAVFVIPKAKIQSNFSFAMASSGDPSTFTFTMDAFPDYSPVAGKEVLFALQILGE